MSRSFDRILVRRIREVFDNHREPVDPGAWKDMERRLNQRRRLRVVHIGRVAGAAALVVALLLVFNPFGLQRQGASSTDQVARSQGEASATGEAASSGTSAASETSPATETSPAEGTSMADKAFIGDSASGGPSSPGKLASGGESSSGQSSPGDSTSVSPSSPEKLASGGESEMIAAAREADTAEGEAERARSTTASTTAEGRHPMEGDQQAMSAEAGKTGRRNSEATTVSSPVLARLEKKSRLHPGIPMSSPGTPALVRASGAGSPGNNRVQTENLGNASLWEKLPDRSTASKDRKSVELNVAFSTLYNYSSSMVSSEANFAGGIVSEFRVLPDLTVSTGVMVSRQYFTTRKQSRELASYLSANTRVDKVGELASFGGFYPYFRDISNKVKLIGVDVPLNIEYRFDRLSVSAGVSSFTYLQEKYRHDYTSHYVVYEYDGEDNIVGSDKMARSETLRESYDPLGKVDLASVLNVAVGYRFDVGTARLVIEPYMKHPLGDLASRDLRFGSRGLRVRLGF